MDMTHILDAVIVTYMYDDDHDDYYPSYYCYSFICICYFFFFDERSIRSLLANLIISANKYNKKNNLPEK